MMNGTLYAIGEIVVFLVGATLVGILFGRAMKRDPGDLGPVARLTVHTELAEAREESAALERKLAAAVATIRELETERSGNGDRNGETPMRYQALQESVAALEARLFDADATIERLSHERRQLELALEAATPKVTSAPLDADSGEAAIGEPASEEGLATEEADSVVAGEAVVESPDAERLHAELMARTAEIERLERVVGDAARFEAELKARDERIDRLEAALQAATAPRSIGESPALGWSGGSGSFADSRIEFDG